MKSKTLLALSIATIMGTTVYAPISLAANTEAPATKQAMASQTAQAKKDGAVIATLIALNNNEITAAQVALQKSNNLSVKRYAKMLQREHTKNLDKTVQLSQKLGIPTVQTSTVTMIQRDGKKEVRGLDAATGNNFDVLYINDMVKNHQAALNLIDTNLLKNANNPALKNHLEKTRHHIEAHLIRAQKIQQQLG